MIRFVTETGSTNTDLASELRAGMAVPEGEWLVATICKVMRKGDVVIEKMDK